MTKQSPSLIADQIATLQELYGQELPEILAQAQKITVPEGIKKIYAVGNGDSYHVALAAVELFAKWNVEYSPVPAYTFLKAELPRLNSTAKSETLVVCISASGSSKICAEIIAKIKEENLAHTMIITGKTVTTNADIVLPVIISEQGRSPGIRTYAASFVGLMALAAQFSSDQLLNQRFQTALVSSAEFLPELISQAEEVAGQAEKWEWPSTMIIGFNGLLGCASFIGAKFVEGSGILASSHELEEWCHVESMSYPLNAPVILLYGHEQTKDQVLKVAGVARKVGRRVLVISSQDQADFKDSSDAVIQIKGVDLPELLPLYHYIPAVVLVHALALKYGRAMFLSDLPISLY